MLFVGEVCSQWQKKKVNRENIYQGHVARKPLIAKIRIIILLQLIGLQLTFVDNGSAKKKEDVSKLLHAKLFNCTIK